MSGHAAYIAAAYCVAALGIAGLILWVVLDAAGQRRALRDLEAGGARRRSGSSPV